MASYTQQQYETPTTHSQPSMFSPQFSGQAAPPMPQQDTNKVYPQAQTSQMPSQSTPQMGTQMNPQMAPQMNPQMMGQFMQQMMIANQQHPQGMGGIGMGTGRGMTPPPTPTYKPKNPELKKLLDEKKDMPHVDRVLAMLDKLFEMDKAQGEKLLMLSKTLKDVKSSNATSLKAHFFEGKIAEKLKSAWKWSKKPATHKTVPHLGQIVGPFGRTIPDKDGVNISIPLKKPKRYLQVSFEFCKMDSFDNERFDFKVNGVQVFSKNMHMHHDAGGDPKVPWIKSLTGQPKNIAGHVNWPDQILMIKIPFELDGETMKLLTPGGEETGIEIPLKDDIQVAIHSHQNEGIDNEFYGLRKTRLVSADTVSELSDLEIHNADLFAHKGSGWTYRNTPIRSLKLNKESIDSMGGPLGRTEGQGVNKTISLDDAKTFVQLNFKFIEFDSWDNEEFRVLLNGVPVTVDKFKYDKNDKEGKRFSVPLTEPMDLNSVKQYKDQIHQYRFNFKKVGNTLELMDKNGKKTDLTIPLRQGDEIVVELQSGLDEGIGNESWGIADANVVSAANNSKLPVL